MGHRVAVLRDGFLQQVDRPRVLYSKPVNRFVAGFIGSPAMNLVDCPTDHGVAQLAGHAVPVDDAVRAAIGSLDGDVTVGVRPEHLRLSSDGIPGEVVVVEELGSESFVHVHVDHRGETLTLVVRDEGETTTARGDNVHLAFAGATHVFDQAGDRLGDD